MFPLAYQRRTGQHDRQHGDIVDNCHDGTETLLLQVRIKTHPDGQLNRQRAVVPVAGDKAVHLAGDDILDIAIAGKRLAHSRRVDVNL